MACQLLYCMAQLTNTSMPHAAFSTLALWQPCLLSTSPTAKSLIRLPIRFIYSGPSNDPGWTPLAKNVEKLVDLLDYRYIIPLKWHGRYSVMKMTLACWPSSVGELNMDIVLQLFKTLVNLRWESCAIERLCRLEFYSLMMHRSLNDDLREITNKRA